MRWIRFVLWPSDLFPDEYVHVNNLLWLPDMFWDIDLPPIDLCRLRDLQNWSHLCWIHDLRRVKHMPQLANVQRDPFMLRDEHLHECHLSGNGHV